MLPVSRRDKFHFLPRKTSGPGRGLDAHDDKTKRDSPARGRRDSLECTGYIVLKHDSPNNGSRWRKLSVFNIIACLRMVLHWLKSQSVYQLLLQAQARLCTNGDGNSGESFRGNPK